MRLYISIFFFLFCWIAKSQNYGVLYNIRYESFQMVKLQEFQRSLVSDWPVKAEQLEAMPSTLTHSIGYYKKLKDHFDFGITVGYSSTGSRFYYQDYSGKLSNDFTLIRYEVVGNFFYLKNINQKSRIRLVGKVEVGFGYSEMDISSQLNIGGTKSEELSTFFSTSAILRLGVGLEYPIKRLTIGVIPMMEGNPTAKLYWKGNTDYFLKNYDGSTLGTDWGGLKLIIYGKIPI